MDEKTTFTKLGWGWNWDGRLGMIGFETRMEGIKGEGGSIMDFCPIVAWKIRCIGSLV